MINVTWLMKGISESEFELKCLGLATLLCLQKLQDEYDFSSDTLLFQNGKLNQPKLNQVVVCCIQIG